MERNFPKTKINNFYPRAQKFVQVIKVIKGSVISKIQKDISFYPLAISSNKSVIKMFLKYLYLTYHTSEIQAGDFYTH